LFRLRLVAVVLDYDRRTGALVGTARWD
jgi:hypothetical protein